MRSSLFASFSAVLLLAGSGCGGDWSNEDVEFAASLPHRSDVTVSLPLQSGLSASGLRESGATAWAVGDPSTAATDTRNAAHGLDMTAELFITILETATRTPPNVRTQELRIWGPFPANDSPGWELQIVMTRQPVVIDARGPDPIEGFYWQIQYKEVSAQDWRQPPLVEGFYQPGEIRHGLGAVMFYAGEFRASGMPSAKNLSDLGTLRRLFLVYDTRADQPHTIVLQATDDAGQVATIAYQELATLSGRLVFDVHTNDPNATHLQAAARWTPEFRGRSDMAVVEGMAAGAHAVECWDGQQNVSFVYNPWNGIIAGDEQRDCAFGPP
ncbi:MAG TPA: hypothetical protein VFA20_22560 [Myxococcaceae bacterium]|nr:hypothetical protein [Myxococcaceae bacterium]